MKLALLTAAVLCPAVVLLAEDPLPRCDVTPGWTQAGALRVYEEDNLYDYMNGTPKGT